MELKERGPFSAFLVLLAIQLLIPLTVVILLASFTKTFFFSYRVKKPSYKDTILLTGGKMTKSLQLARLLSKAGYRIILTEEKKYRSSGHAWSNCIDAFYLLPSVSEDYLEYEKTLVSIVEKENVSLMIPVASPVSVYRDAELKKNIGEKLNIFHFLEDDLGVLDNKFNLCQKARELGLPSPDVYLIKSKTDLSNFDFESTKKKFILKSLSYSPVERLKRPLLPFVGHNEYFETLDISSRRPWVLQEFVEGREFCTHSTVRNGKILLHCCCESSEFQLRYKHVDNPDIYGWVEKFVKAMNLSGQISFDFIIRPNGEVVPIECNPRTHSAITTFYNSCCAAKSYISNEKPGESNILCLPDPEAKETYWFYHELWELFKSRSFVEIRDRIKLIFFGKEAILDSRDPLPFMMVYHWQIPSLLIQAIKSRATWVRIDFNIGKLVEVNGD